MTKKKSNTKVKIDRSRRIIVTQVGSPIGRSPDQRKTLIGLGLNKMHKVRSLEDTDSVRGMVNKVRHLVKVEPILTEQN